jgi:uncharacterized protein
MNEAAIPKPRPIANELSAGYWDATSAGQLAIQQCDHCGQFAHPPTPVCGSCFAVPPAFSFTPVSGMGRVSTWTVFRQTFLPGFSDDVPYVIGVVELDEQPGLRLIGRLNVDADHPVSVGDRASVTFDRLETGEFVPAFDLVEEAL